MKDIIVIGGGIAGLQSAILTAKAREETLVLDTDESLIHNTSNIKNLIGHDSVSGQELLESGKNKFESFGGEIREMEVTKVIRTDNGFEVMTEENTYSAEYIVVASAGMHSYLEELDLEYEEGVEGPYMMDKHIVTDDSNKAADKVYVAGLANTWEYQTSVAIGDGAKAAVNLLSDKYGEPFTDHDT